MRPMPKSVFGRQPFDNVKGVQQVTDLFRAIDKPNVDEWAETDHQNRAEAIFKKFGFRLSVKPSTLPGAGNGVYLQGVREQGQIVSIYPGKCRIRHFVFFNIIIIISFRYHLYAI